MLDLTNNPLVLIIVLLIFVVAIVAVITIAIPFLIKKDINIQAYLKQAETILNTAEDITNTVGGILPATPAISILKILEVWASKAVGGAEQLYVSSQLPADQRNAKAKEIVYAALKIAGVIVTPELETLINGAIEESVLVLGHATNTLAILPSTPVVATVASTSDQTSNQAPAQGLQVAATQNASVPVLNNISVDDIANLTNIVQKLQATQTIAQ